MPPADSNQRSTNILLSWRALIGLAGPLVILNLTFVVIQLTDAWIVGKISVKALAALTVPSTILFAISSLGYGFLSGLNGLVAQANGAGNRSKCTEIAWIGILVSAAAGVVLCLTLLPMAGLFHAFPSRDPSLTELESSYFAISTLSFTPVFLIGGFAGFFLGIRCVAPVIWASFAGVTVNVVTSYALTLGAFGAPALGINGAAWGTVIAASVETGVLAICFLSGEHARTFGTRRPRCSVASLKRVVSIGAPAGAQAGVDALSWGVVLSVLLASLSEADLAAGGVLLRLTQLSFLPAEGLATGLLTLVGTAVGGGRTAVASRLTKTAFHINLTFMASIGVIFYVFRNQILASVTESEAVISIGSSVMIFISIMQVFDAMNVTYLHALQGSGDTRWPSAVTALLTVVVLIGGGVLAMLVIERPTSGHIWTIALAYVALQGVLFRRRWLSGKWKRDLPERVAAADSRSGTSNPSTK